MRQFFNYLFLYVFLLIFGGAGCILFGLQDIPCVGDDNCPSGQSCFYPRQDSQNGLCFTAEQVDDFYAQNPQGPVISRACARGPCHLMPDSSPYCANEQGPLTTPPLPGEDFFGQDCNYLFSTHQFTAGHIGEEYRGVDTITDDLLGLVWEAESSYAFGIQSTLKGRCAELVPGDGDPWNLPSLQDMMTLMDYGRRDLAWAPDGPVLNFETMPDFFLKEKPAGLSGTLNVGEGNCQFIFDSKKAYALCASGGGWVCPDDNNVQINTDSVEDLRAGLIWARPFGEALDWRGALGHCQNLSLEGHTDWRLPSAKELSQLVDMEQENGYCKALGDHLDWPDTANMQFWTSTPYVSHDVHNAWTWKFKGPYLGNVEMSSPNLARCVRSHSTGQIP